MLNSRRGPHRIWTERQSLRTPRGEIHYLLKRSVRRRSLQITVTDAGQVSVAAPSRLGQKGIDAFIIQKADWIARQTAWAEQRRRILKAKNYEHGSTFLFLGVPYPLSIQPGEVRRCRIRFDGRCWHVVVPAAPHSRPVQELVKDKLIHWYRQQAKEVLGGRVLYFARRMNLEPNEIHIRSQRSIWGSCHTARRAVYLNWQLVMMPMNVIDYVAVHELAHLVHGNHSKRFWNKVAKVLPDFRERQQWIKRNRMDLVLP